MKRSDFIKLLTRNGWWLKREGDNHDVYTNGIDIEPVARHRELNEQLVKAIIKRRGLK